MHKEHGCAANVTVGVTCDIGACRDSALRNSQKPLGYDAISSAAESQNGSTHLISSLFFLWHTNRGLFSDQTCDSTQTEFKLERNSSTGFLQGPSINVCKEKRYGNNRQYKSETKRRKRYKKREISSGGSGLL